MFNGVLTALITPFKDGKIDFDALGVLIEKQIKAGASGLVLLGTTAETPALTSAEKQAILDYAAPLIKGRAKLVIGAGSNSTEVTLSNVRMAAKYSPDAALIVTPYYNKPNLSGMIAHYKAVAAEGLPIMLYHIPGRTGQKLSLAFFDKLLEAVPEIIAVKESDYDINHITAMSLKYAGGRLDYICGNDDIWPVFLGLGNSAIISAAGNTMAPVFVKTQKLFNEGKVKEAANCFAKAYGLIGASYLEVNPTCSKYILSKLGICGADVRLPLGPLDKTTETKIDEILAKTDKEFFI